MKVFITGGAGYIGSTLVGELLHHGHDVTVMDSLRYRQDSLLQHFHSPRFHFVKGDVRNCDILLKNAGEADIIIPLAAIVGAPACDADPRLATDVNYKHVADIAESCRGRMIIYPNTNSGYGTGQGTSMCTEDSPLQPISHYGRTKCDAERVVLANGGISLRLATVFGVSPRMRLDLLVNDFTYKAMSDGYIVLFEKDFKRNYIHVRDVASAFLHMIDKYAEARGSAFNVGLSSANISKHELALKIKEQVPKFSIQIDEIRKDLDKRDYVVSNAKIEGLGWQPRHSLDDGICELIDAFPMLFSAQQRYTNL